MKMGSPRPHCPGCKTTCGGVTDCIWLEFFQSPLPTVEWTLPAGVLLDVGCDPTPLDNMTVVLGPSVWGTHERYFETANVLDWLGFPDCDYDPIDPTSSIAADFAFVSSRLSLVCGLSVQCNGGTCFIQFDARFWYYVTRETIGEAVSWVANLGSGLYLRSPMKMGELVRPKFSDYPIPSPSIFPNCMSPRATM